MFAGSGFWRAVWCLVLVDLSSAITRLAGAYMSVCIMFVYVYTPCVYHWFNCLNGKGVLRCYWICLDYQRNVCGSVLCAHVMCVLCVSQCLCCLYAFTYLYCSIVLCLGFMFACFNFQAPFEFVLAILSLSLPVIACAICIDLPLTCNMWDVCTRYVFLRIVLWVCCVWRRV